MKLLKSIKHNNQSDSLALKNRKMKKKKKRKKKVKRKKMRKK